METTKIQPAPRGQRSFRVDDPYIQPAYKVAHAHAQENGRNFILYRDFYLGHFDEDVAECTRAQMQAAKRHFRIARAHSEGPDPALERKLGEKLAREGLLEASAVSTGIPGAKKLVIHRIPKRYRRI